MRTLQLLRDQRNFFRLGATMTLLVFLVQCPTISLRAFADRTTLVRIASRSGSLVPWMNNELSSIREETRAAVRAALKSLNRFRGEIGFMREFNEYLTTVWITTPVRIGGLGITVLRD